MNPREQAQAITDATGIRDGGKTTEAFTRFFHRAPRVGWNSLTQDDFAMIEDAFADAAGRPRRKRKNNLVWKIGFWWHWHITSPIIYPLAEAPFTACRKIYWHAWKKRRGGEVMTGVLHDDGEVYLEFTPWREARDRRREALAGLPLRCRAAAHLGWLHSGWDWCCPACGIDFGAPDDTARTEAVATEGLNAHVAEDHAGAMPGECGVTRLFWIRRNG